MTGLNLLKNMVVPPSPKQIFITNFTLNIGHSTAKQIIRAVKKKEDSV